MAHRLKRVKYVDKLHRLKSRATSSLSATTATFTLTGPLDIDPGNNFYLIPVSGLTTPIYDGQIVSMEISLTIDDLSLLIIEIYNPASTVVTCYGNGDLIGNTLTNTVFGQSTDPAINTGSEPYTGVWATSDSGTPWSLFNGEASNGDWQIVVINNGATTGTFLGATLTFNI